VSRKSKRRSAAASCGSRGHDGKVAQSVFRHQCHAFLARAVGTKVVALHVSAQFHVLRPHLPPSPRRVSSGSRAPRRSTREVFDRVATSARELGVACVCVSRTGEHVWQEIIQAAEASG
jgi:nucleotide-binding universal stress UspA family protein